MLFLASMPDILSAQAPSLSQNRRIVSATELSVQAMKGASVSEFGEQAKQYDSRWDKEVGRSQSANVLA